MTALLSVLKQEKSRHSRKHNVNMMANIDIHTQRHARIQKFSSEGVQL